MLILFYYNIPGAIHNQLTSFKKRERNLFCLSIPIILAYDRDILHLKKFVEKYGDKMNVTSYNWKEELANAITHGIGFVLSIPALVLLIVFAVQKDNPLYLTSFLVYGISLMLLYVCSTLLHSFKPCKARTVFNIMDHAAIYVLIAGSYTPFVLITIQGTLGWTLFGIIWGLAIAGIIYKIFMTGKLKLLSTSVYLLMGWMVMFAIKPLYTGLTPAGFWLLATGGIMFTVGAIFYSIPKVPYMHAIWHLFVIAGTAFMYFCILFYV